MNRKREEDVSNAKEGAEAIAVPGESLEAIISRAQAATSTERGQVINYYFPVEVEVVGRSSTAEMERIAQYVYNDLLTALQNYVS